MFAKTQTTLTLYFRVKNVKSSIKNNTLDNQQRTKTADTDAEDNGRKSKENGPNDEEITLSDNIAQQC